MLLLQRPQTQFPASTARLTAVCNSSSKDPSRSLVSLGIHSHIHINKTEANKETKENQQELNLLSSQNFTTRKILKQIHWCEAPPHDWLVNLKCVFTVVGVHEWERGQLAVEGVGLMWRLHAHSLHLPVGLWGVCQADITERQAPIPKEPFHSPQRNLVTITLRKNGPKILSDPKCSVVSAGYKEGSTDKEPVFFPDMLKHR